MANPTIKIKRSHVAGKVPHYPNTLDLGEFAINTADGKVFIVAGQHGVGVGTTVQEVGLSTENVLSQSLRVDGDTDLNGAIDVDGHTNLDNVSVAGVTTFSGETTFSGRVNFGAEVRDGDDGFGSNGQILSSDGTDTKWITVGDITAGAASSVGVTDSSTTNATYYPAMVSGTSGNRFIRVDNSWTYNPSTNTGSLPKLNNLITTGVSTISGFEFPGSDGTNGQVLATDGNGTLSFITAASGSGTATTISQSSTTAGAAQTAFTTPNIFDDGLKTYPVEVFVQGLRMRVGTASSCDYYIQAPNKIYFNYGLEAERRVIARVGFGHTVQEEQFTATQGQTTFNIPGEPANQEKFHAYLNGVLLRRVTDYTCGSPVVLGEACKAGDEVILMSASAEDLFTANEGQTKFTPTDTGTTSDNVQVYLNGIYLEETTDWTMGSPSVTIINPATGLEVGDELDVVITR